MHQRQIQSSIVAFQFYDRMVQCLQHVTSNLLGLTQLLESPERLYNPTEWSQFQSEIRARYTMESEKVLFDAIIEGRPLDEIKQEREAMMTPSEDNIELF